MTLYPVSKCTPERAVDMVEMYGPERLLVNSAGDWGPSKPTAVPDFILAMRQRGHGEAVIRKIVYENPLEILPPKPQIRVYAAGDDRWRKCGVLAKLKRGALRSRQKASCLTLLRLKLSDHFIEQTTVQRSIRTASIVVNFLKCRIGRCGNSQRGAAVGLSRLRFVGFGWRSVSVRAAGQIYGFASR